MFLVRNIVSKNPEPSSDNFDPNADSWVMISRNGGGCHGYLMSLIDDLFENTNASDYYSKSQVLDTCLKFGYFGFGNFVICYIPQSNTSSLDLMKE